MTERGRGSRRAAFAALLSLLPGAAGAGDLSSRAVGTNGSEFLNVDVDPRGIAMGGAFTAVAHDAYAMYWNPAGLSQIPRASAAAMHNEYVGGVRFQYLSYAQRFTDTSVIGGSFRYMDAGNIIHRDISGNNVGAFRPRNYVWEVGWGKAINDLTDSEKDVSLGVSGRWFHSDLLEHADGFSGDIGIQVHYTESYAPYNFGFVLQHVGKGQKFDKVRDNLPTQGKLGASLQPRPHLLLSLDGVMPLSNTPYLALGSELSLQAREDLKVLLRGGFSMRNQFNDLEGLRGLSLGLGAKALSFSFDYVFVPFGILGETHRFSVTWNLPAKRSRRFRRA